MGADRDGATGGTYTLLIALEEDASVETGSLGTVELPAGHYAYTGSALGPGGFARVDRHREVAAGERDVRQWHVDHLLGQEAATATAAIRSPGADVECAVADAVDAEEIDGFGATDCGCSSHLAHAQDREALYDAAWAAHQAVDEAAKVGGDGTAGD
jgi:endonuclease-3